MKQLLVLAAVVLIATISVAQKAPAAADKYRTLREEVDRSYKARNYPAVISACSKALEFTNGNSRWVVNLAGAYALAGRKDDAFATLTRYAAMGLGALEGFQKDADFASLRKDQRWAEVLRQTEENRKAVSSGSVIAMLKDPELLTEDIAWDGKTGRYFISSIEKQKIVTIAADKKIADFAGLTSDPGWPVMALVADQKRRILWATVAAIPGFEGSFEDDTGRSALLKLDLDKGEYLRRFDLQDSTPRVLGDAALLPDGGLIVSDSRSGGIFRFFDGTFTRIDRDEFVSPQTPAIAPDGRFAFVADYVRGIGRIDLNGKLVTWVAHPDTVALNGIDGLYLRGRDLYAIQNGTSPSRVLRCSLDARMTAITACTVLVANTPGLGEPTHGVFTNGAFVFLQNSGWEAILDNGRPKGGVRRTPASLRAVPLPR